MEEVKCMKRYFKKEEMARCFRENGARCKECPLKQPAEKLPEGVEESLEALVTNVLEPARERLGKPIVVNSGYRCQVHNKTVGGVANSQHMRGEAADIAPLAQESRKNGATEPRKNGAMGSTGFNGSSGSRSSMVQELAKAIVENGKWDQLILYPTFVHVSYKRNGPNRKQILRKTANGYAKVQEV